MLHHQQYTPPPVRSLVNHLTDALDACDALVRTQGAAADPHNLLRLELTAIAHVLQAREDMKELRFADGAIRSQITLFLAVTGCLEETTPSSAAAAGLEAAATRLIGGRIEVATLMALTTAMRDVVELCFLTSNDESEANASRCRPPSPRRWFGPRAPTAPRRPLILAGACRRQCSKAAPSATFLSGAKSFSSIARLVVLP